MGNEVLKSSDELMDIATNSFDKSERGTATEILAKRVIEAYAEAARIYINSINEPEQNNIAAEAHRLTDIILDIGSTLSGPNNIIERSKDFLDRNNHSINAMPLFSKNDPLFQTHPDYTVAQFLNDLDHSNEYIRKLIEEEKNSRHSKM